MSVSLFHRCQIFIAWMGLFHSAQAQTPLVVSGVTDRQVTADSVTFRVPVSNGFAYSVFLDGSRVPANRDVSVTNADYHELIIGRTNVASGTVTNRLIRFIVRSSERKDAEWGLRPWVPLPAINSTASELIGSHLRILLPQDYPMGLDIPVAAWIENTVDKAVRANAILKADGQPAIQLRRGAGSGFLTATKPGPMVYDASIPGVAATKTIHLETNTVWKELGGSISGTVVWPPNSRIAVTNHVAITAGSSLSIGEGSVVKLSPGVNITVDGALIIGGSGDRPVVFTPVSRSQPWGGFFMRNSSGSIDASGTLFVASGADPKGGAGHKSEQCLFFIDQRPRLNLTNCAAFDLAGQFGHAASGDTNAADPNWTQVSIVRTLIQRCVTGGEWNGCNLKLLDSALLETPIATPIFSDNDEDGIYFTYGVFEVRDSVIGWTRDDCIDAGSNDGGSVTASNVWCESSFHEAFAWSGGGGTSGTRRATNDHCIAINCGQGYECGWSRGGVSFSPDVFVTQCLAVGNGVGARFGDNYDWSYYGFLRITNSILLNNYRDVWGLNWQTDNSGWIYRDSGMDIQNNFLTVSNPFHLANTVWNPSRDAWRLADFMSTPPEAPVGVAFATWTNQFAMPVLFAGVSVGLSSFSTNFVFVDYDFESDAGILSSGRLAFSPGETVKRIFPSGFDLAGKNLVRLTLRNPVHGELTGVDTILFLGEAPASRMSLQTDSRQMDFARLQEGAMLALNTPAAKTIRASYKWEIPGQTLSTGIAEFQPGETMLWLLPPANIIPSGHPLLRLAITPLDETPWEGPSSLYLVESAPNLDTPETTLLGKGSKWSYNDSVANTISSWFSTSYNDSSWHQGLAPLGYGNTPKEATTVSYGADSGHKNITTLFRNKFVVTNAAEFESLTFNTLRDDGAIVYLNGVEMYRENMPTGAIVFSTTASTNCGGTVSIYYSTILKNHSIPLQEGTNTVAVEIHQNNGSSSDILFDLEIVGNPAPAPEPSPLVYWGKFDPENLTLIWNSPSWSLEHADNVDGPFTRTTLASPAFLSMTNRQLFYRLAK